MKIRPASLDDTGDLAMIHVEGWRSAYGGLVDQAYLDSLKPEDREQAWAKWLADEKIGALIAHDGDGRPAGFIGFGPLRTPIPGTSPIRPLYTAEIYALYILPAYWRAGLGRRLMAAAAAELQARKHKSVCLWVLEGNKRAIGFYKAMGGQRCGTTRIEIAGKTLPEVAFGWRDATILQMPLS